MSTKILLISVQLIAQTNSATLVGRATTHHGETGVRQSRRNLIRQVLEQIGRLEALRSEALCD